MRNNKYVSYLSVNNVVKLHSSLPSALAPDLKSAKNPGYLRLLKMSFSGTQVKLNVLVQTPRMISVSPTAQTRQYPSKAASFVPEILIHPLFDLFKKI